jgi:hypothetical protein
VESNVTRVAHGNRADLGTNFYNDTRGFVTHNDRRNAAAGAAVIAVNVASANSTGLHLNENIVASQLWLEHVLQLEISNIFKEESFSSRKDNL